MFCLPDEMTTCLFDLDRVLTQTATIHARAWKEMFDEFLRAWSERTGQTFDEFHLPADYDMYVDGKRRFDGVHSFLEARGIELPAGAPADPPEVATIHALGKRKNELVLRLIREQGVEPYEGSVHFLEAARDAGLRRAVVSSSTNCRDVLRAAGIEQIPGWRPPCPAVWLRFARASVMSPEICRVRPVVGTKVGTRHHGSAEGFAFARETTLWLRAV